MPFLQVSAWFGWLDFLKYQADRFGKKISWINLDETSIKRSDAGSGLVVKRSWWPAGHQAPGPAASTREQRGCATFVCLCTPDTALQAALPKIWIGNQYLFKASELKACASRQPPQVVLLREKTAWMTAALMPRIFKEIAASLKTLRGESARRCGHGRSSAASSRFGYSSSSRLWFVGCHTSSQADASMSARRHTRIFSLEISMPAVVHPFAFGLSERTVSRQRLVRHDVRDLNEVSLWPSVASCV